MKPKLLKTVTAIVVGVLGLSLLTLAPTVYADEDPCDPSVPEAVRNAAGCNGHDNALPNIIVDILNAIIAVTGLVAVIFVLIGGINYMTSTGDAGKLEKAKKTILYACIGLAVCVLAFAIVNFVIIKIIG